jgi:hypothetical protein
MASITQKTISLIFGLALITTVAYAQELTEREKVAELERQKEFQKQRLVNARMDSAVQLMNLEQYEAADTKFRSVLTSLKSIPSDLAYHFGKNSYHLEKYKQSVDWLTKYIQLKGTTGQYSEDAALWLKRAEEALVKQRATQTTKALEVLSRDYTIDCGTAGKVLCPVCGGTTVVVRRDYLGEKYSTCGFCRKSGYLSCEDYNLLLRGQLKPSNDK